MLNEFYMKINREKRSSKNYVLFLGETGAETNQAPCLSLVQFQIDLPLKSITLNLANVHIYKNNIEPTKELLGSNEDIKFELNV